MTRRDAANQWVANGGPVRTQCALTFTPTVAYSYAEPIAILDTDPATGARSLMYSDATGAKKFSMTTSHHISYVRGAAAVAGLQVVEVSHETIRELAKNR
jgi:hypothetical protein